MSNLINCGERRIQTHLRIALTDICTRYGIREGDAVEVFIRKIDYALSTRDLNNSNSCVNEREKRTENKTKMINGGERRIQTLYRVSLKDLCERYNVKEGEAVEVFIRLLSKQK